MGVTEDDADLGGGSTLTGELDDLVLDLGGSGLEPGGRGTAVGQGGSRDTLSLGVKTTHDCGCVVWSIGLR